MAAGEKVTLPIERNINTPEKLIIIGTNVGGPLALTQMLSQLPKGFPAAIIVVQRIRPGFTKVVAEILKRTCKLSAHEAEDGEPLQRGNILVVPAGTVLTIDEAGSAFFIRLDNAPEKSEQNATRCDQTMIAAAHAFGRNAIGVLLTGLGEDGRDGMSAIAEAGGTAIAQDEATCVVYDLPGSAVMAGVVKEILPLWSIADRLVEIAMGGIGNAAAA